MKIIKLLLILLFILLLSACMSDKTVETAHDHDHEEEEHHNYLFISDAEQAMISVFDLESETTVATIDTTEIVDYLYASPENNYALITHEDSVGIISKEDLALTDLTIYGTHPHHFTIHEETGVLFFDGDEENAVSAQVVVVSDESIAENEVIDTIDLGIAMHGVAEPYHDDLLISHREANSESHLPTQVSIYESHGDHYDFHVLLEETCPNLHGSASNTDHVIFGCSDGVLLIEIADEITTHKINNPEYFPENTRISHIAGHADLHHFIGYAKPSYFFIIEEESIEEIAWENTEVVAFTLDAHGEHLIILDNAGELHILEAEDGSEVGHIETEIEIEEEHSPSLAIDDDHSLYITNAHDGEIIVVDLEELAIHARYSVEGHPLDVIWLGGEEAHAHEEEEAHTDEEEEHTH